MKEHIVLPKSRTLEEYKLRESILIKQKGELLAADAEATRCGSAYVAARKASKEARDRLIRLIG